MNFYQLRKYIKYRIHAKGRHGVHSPFVYALIEQGLNSRLPDGMSDQPLARVEHYFEPRNSLAVSEKTGDYFYFERPDDATDWQRNDIQKEEIARFLMHQTVTPPFNIDQLSLMVDESPQYLPAIFQKYAPLMHQQSVCIIHQIHQNPAMNAIWERLCQDPAITLSIDLFKIGLLFINPDFKEKQHFVLKCPQ